VADLALVCPVLSFAKLLSLHLETVSDLMRKWSPDETQGIDEQPVRLAVACRKRS